ncbi:MAG: extracellular solute-binding protein [Eubacteriales bacterium]
MDMKKRLISVLLCVLMVFSVVEVGKLNTIGNDEGMFQQKPTIYFWYTDENLSDYISSMALKFNEEYNVRVTPVLQSGLEYLEEINQESLYTQTVPDIYLITNDSLEKAYLSGLACEIEDAEGTVSEENFSSSALKAVTYQGKVIGYPYYAETSAFLYNKTFLEDWAETQILAEIDAQAGEEAQEEVDEEGSGEAEVSVVEEEPEITDEELTQQVAERVSTLIPSTFDELLEFANSYDAPVGVESVFNWDVEDIFYNYFFIGNYMNVGGEYGDNPDDISIYNIEAITAMKLYQDMNQFFSIEADSVAYDAVIEDFIAGKLVFTTATTDVLATLEQAIADEEFLYEYGIAPIPDLNEALPSRNLAVTSTLVINGYSTQKDLANQFAQFLAVEQAESLYAQTGKMAANSNIDYGDIQLEYFMEEYADSVPMPKMMTTSNFWVQLEVAFSQIWNGASVTDTLKSLSEQILTQVTGEAYEETYIPEPSDEEITEYIDGVLADEIQLDDVELED